MQFESAESTALDCNEEIWFLGIGQIQEKQREEKTMLHLSLPTILLVDDQLGRTWKRVLSRHAVPLVAETADMAEDLFEKHPGVRLIVMDGCLGGRTLNTLHLVQKFRRTFRGPIIAASSTPNFCDQLCHVGCDHRVIEKTDLPKLVVRLLSEMR